LLVEAIVTALAAPSGDVDRAWWPPKLKGPYVIPQPSRAGYSRVRNAYFPAWTWKRRAGYGSGIQNVQVEQAELPADDLLPGVLREVAL
jgi:hypothetical protein